MNKLRKNLEEALVEAKSRREKGLDPLICVVFGETSCGKTAIITDFLRENNLSNFNIESTLIRPRVIPEFLDLTSEPATFSSSEIDKLSESEIVFIDDYDFASLESRNELLRLIKNLEVVDIRKECKESNYLPKINKPLMFIVVLHTLSIRFDRFGGYVNKLTPDEQEFFKVENLSDKASPFKEDNIYVIPYRSNGEDLLEYIINRIDEYIDSDKKHEKLTEEKLEIKIKNAEKNKLFARKLLRDPRFEFTDFNKKERAASKLSEYDTTSRSVSHLFLLYYGDEINKSFLIKNWNSFGDSKMKKNIIKILDDYPELDDGEDYAEVKAEILKSKD